MDPNALLNELVASRLVSVGVALALVGLVQLFVPSLVSPVSLILTAAIAGVGRALTAVNSP